jgi:HPt (histidine-containing phosphotransfer) domain-containing protein
MKAYCDVLDRSEALAAVGGDVVFLAELTGILRAACPTLLEDMRASLAAGNLSATGHAARLLRVAAENVVAKRIASAALALETIAGQKCPEAAGEAYWTLRQEVEQCLHALADLESEIACSEN